MKGICSYGYREESSRDRISQCWFDEVGGRRCIMGAKGTGIRQMGGVKMGELAC